MSMFTEAFEEPEVDFPNKIVENAIHDFENVTDGLASLRLVELDTLEKISSRLKNLFQFQLLLTSRYLRGYSFEVIRLGYDVSIYPVAIAFESEIAKEIGLTSNFMDDYIKNITNENELKESLEHIFRSNKFKKTVGGLMKIARDKQGEALI